MKRDGMALIEQGAPGDRIDGLGKRIIEVIEQESDPAVVLSALVFVSAAVCQSMAGESLEGFQQVAQTFVGQVMDVVDRHHTRPEVTH